MKRVMVTGATGFLGSALCARLVRDGVEVVAAVRPDSPGVSRVSASVTHLIGDIGPATSWEGALEGVDVVFHLAARVHRVRERGQGILDEYRRVNVYGTERLARCCVRAGVRRLVFVSSVKAQGEGRAEPYVEDACGDGLGPYGLSKREAEERLAAVAGATGLEVAVVRPPVVYGPGVKANVLQLLRAIYAGVPLPLGGIRNRRSMISVDNLVDAMILCARRVEAAGRAYLVSDGEDVSTSELVLRMGKALGKPARLVRVPPTLLRAAGIVLRRPGLSARLLETLALDTTRIRKELQWAPKHTLQDGLERTAAWFRATQSQ